MICKNIVRKMIIIKYPVKKRKLGRLFKWLIKLYVPHDCNCYYLNKTHKK